MSSDGASKRMAEEKKKATRRWLFFRYGAKETRTPDPYNAIVVLYQLSYSPGTRATIASPFFFVKQPRKKPRTRFDSRTRRVGGSVLTWNRPVLRMVRLQEVEVTVPRILSTGFDVPTQVLTNAELSSRVDTSDEWIFSHTGIRERRIADPGQATSDLAAAAGRQALERAGLDPRDLDLVLVATSTPDYLGFPSTASLVQNALGAVNAGAVDLAAACTGFIYGLETARAFVAAGSARHVLVIGAEVFSRIVDWGDRNTCILFGDGAGAVLVGPSAPGLPEPWFPPSILRSDGSGAASLLRPAGGTRTPVPAHPSELYLAMDGRKVYTFAITVVRDVILELLGRHGLTPADVDWFVPHQANVRIVASAAQRLGVPLEKFYLNMERYANTSGATIPLALAEMDQAGLLRRGQTIVTVGFGAGLSWGANLFRW